MDLIDIYRPDYPGFKATKKSLDAMLKKHGIGETNRLLLDRNKMIRLAESDPLNYGTKLPHWKTVSDMLRVKDEVLLNGGNRGAKTEFCFNYTADLLVNGLPWLDGEEKKRRSKNLIVACFHSNSQSSIIQQQFGLYNYLPPDIRDMGKGKKASKETKHANVSFLRATGFANNSIIMPNGNVCLFYSYGQDPKDIGQGYDYDFAWGDELMPIDLLEFIAIRLVSRSGKLLLSFAPITGHTPTVARFQDGSTITSSSPADPELFPGLADKDGNLPRLVKGCPKGEMPYTADCRNPKQGIVYFHSIMNPFSPYKNIVNKCMNKSSDFVKMVAYGYATKMDSGAFPRFGNNHIIDKKRLEEIKQQPHCLYCSADPAGRKSWFISWYIVTNNNEVVIYREWPTFQEWGEWAFPPKGKREDGPSARDYLPGPAQRAGAGWGIEEYKDLVLKLEGWTQDYESGLWDGTNAEVMEERIIDPRFSKQAPGGEGTDILSLMEDEQVGFNGHVIGPRMEWSQARGNAAMGGLNPTDIGIQIINGYMSYNDEKPIDALNHPRLYVLDDCKQNIYAFQHYSAMGTEKDALKDIVDPTRYLLASEVNYLDSSQLQCLGGGRSY